MTDTPRDQGDDLRGRLARALMGAMRCKMQSDIPEGPCCEFPPACHGHDEVWYCDQHDWHETDNRADMCGYAWMLADALLPVVTAHTDAEVQTALAEQREQIVAALEKAAAQLTHLAHAQDTLDSAAPERLDAAKAVLVASRVVKVGRP